MKYENIRSYAVNSQKSQVEADSSGKNKITEVKKLRSKLSKNEKTQAEAESFDKYEIREDKELRR